MSLSLNIPPHAEATLRDAWGDGLDRAAFEGLVIESYRNRRVSAGEVAGLLGLDSSLAALAWLAARGVPVNYSVEDLEEDRRTLAALFPELNP